MGALVLTCGTSPSAAPLPAFAEHPDAELRAVPARPGKADLAPVLAELAGRRLVVHGTDADLAAVVLRLLRTERLAEVPVGFVPTGDSRVAPLWGLPADPGRAAQAALTGEIEPIPLIRDDVGGVLLGLGEIRTVRGKAYCDDDVALRGQAGRIRVTPDPDGTAGVAVEVVRTGLLGRRRRAFHGRAFQLGCLPVAVVRDGVAYDRPVQRWTWYPHTEPIRAVRGLL